MKTIPAGLHLSLHGDTGKCDFGVISAGLELCFSNVVERKVRPCVGAVAGGNIDSFDVEVWLQQNAIRDEEGTSREVAVSHVRLTLHTDAGRQGEEF